MIIFWLSYWKERGLSFPEGLSPRIIKAMIAKESSFNPSARSKVKRSSATGLMQMTSTARVILSGRPNRKGYIESGRENLHISQDVLNDPLINVAIGIRWLAHKHSQLPKKQRDLFNTIKYYNQWNQAGEKYAKEVLDLANRTCN